MVFGQPYWYYSPFLFISSLDGGLLFHASVVDIRCAKKKISLHVIVLVVVIVTEEMTRYLSTQMMPTFT